MSTYCVYGLHGDDGIIRYVGRRSCDYNRLRLHLNQARRYRKTPCHRWILLLEEQGEMLSETVIHPDLNLDESYELERQEIRKRGRLSKGDGILLNVTSGGQGSTGRRVSEATRKKMSEAMLGNTNGRHTKGMNLGISRAACMPVDAYAADGTFLIAFPSQASAARHYGIGQPHIQSAVSSSLSGSMKQGGSLLLGGRYIRFRPSGKDPGAMRVLRIFDPNGFRTHHVNAADAARSYNVAHCRIASAVRDKCRFNCSKGSLHAEWVLCTTEIMMEIEL